MFRLLIFCLTSMVACSIAHATHTGHVYIDKNANGRFDKEDKAFSGVLVSDGLHVVKTASDGSFTLPGHAKERFIFITTPSGYKTDNAYYQRISADVTSYDFGVTPCNKTISPNGSHKFIHISDTEIHGSITNNEHSDWVQNLRDYAANENVAFIMHGGDICYENGLRNHIRLMNTRNMNVPVFYSIGNHDLVKGKYGEQLFEQIYGPVYYSFDVGSVHYMVTPMMNGDYRPSYLPEDVYKWIKNDLAMTPKGKPIIVFGHDLPTTEDNFRFNIKGDPPLDLDAHNLKAWLYGHWHISHIHKHKNAYSICSLTPIRGGIDHSAGSFRVMHIDKNGDFTSELRYPYINKSVRIASVNNMESIISPSGALQIAVNAYSADTHVKRIVCQCVSAERKVIGSTLLKAQTDFAWNGQMDLPPAYRGTMLTIKATAEFENGETAITSALFCYRSQPVQPIAKPTGNWTNLLGNAAHNNGKSQCPSLQNPRLAWINNIGSNICMTSPIVYNEAVYVASVDENYQGKACVICLDARNGTLRWKYNVENSIKNSIVAADGRIFAQDTDGNLYAIDAQNGTLEWKKKLSTDKVLPSLIEGLATQGGIIYAGSGKGLCAINAATGKVLWTNKDWRQNQGSTATLSIDNNILIGSAHWGALYGNDIQTGKCLWKVEKDGIRHRSSSAVMDGDVFYLTSGESFFIMDTRNGEILFRKKLPFSVNVASSPLVTEHEIIFGTASEGIVALDRETWEEKWRFRTGNAMIYTAPYFRNPSATVEASPVLSGKNIIAGGADGVLYMIDKTTGSLVWKHETGAPILATAAISGNMIYAADYSGNVYGFIADDKQ